MFVRLQKQVINIPMASRKFNMRIIISTCSIYIYNIIYYIYNIIYIYYICIKYIIYILGAVAVRVNQRIAQREVKVLEEM